MDDDGSVVEAVTALLRSLGFAAKAFSSGQEFLESPHRRRTAFLIADFNMPGMSGLDLHRHLAASSPPIPTVLITAYPDDRIRARALGAGIVSYLHKPFDEEELLACIRACLAPAG
ncbi:MAG TPA: response regulator [Crenalkalicoccus sp.]|nr:response regulator [Crenalkalicoccus sp.]